MLANRTLSHTCLAAEPMLEVGVLELHAAAQMTESGAIQQCWDEPTPANAPPDRFLQFCMRSFGEFQGPQVAQDISWIFPSVHSAENSPRCGPGPVAALAAVVPAFREACASTPAGAPDEGTLVEDIGRRWLAETYLASLARAMATAENEVLTGALTAAMGALGVEIPAGLDLAAKLVGPAATHVWICEERKLAKSALAQYSGSGVANGITMAIVGSGCVRPILAHVDFCRPVLGPTQT